MQNDDELNPLYDNLTPQYDNQVSAPPPEIQTENDCPYPRLEVTEEVIDTKEYVLNRQFPPVNPNNQYNPTGQTPFEQTVNIQVPHQQIPYGYSTKSRTVAGLFGIFLGALGVHNFYLGFIGKGLTQLLLTLFTCGTLAFVSAIWGFIEGIICLASTKKTDGNGFLLK